MTYVLGDPDLTHGTYSFIEQPNICGYTQTTSVTGVPAFIVHDEINAEFLMYYSTDQSYIGQYPVTIDSSIEVPNDY